MRWDRAPAKLTSGGVAAPVDPGGGDRRVLDAWRAGLSHHPGSSTTQAALGAGALVGAVFLLASLFWFGLQVILLALALLWAVGWLADRYGEMMALPRRAYVLIRQMKMLVLGLAVLWLLGYLTLFLFGLGILTFVMASLALGFLLGTRWRYQ
jgi:hypothetical protein